MKNYPAGVSELHDYFYDQKERIIEVSISISLDTALISNEFKEKHDIHVPLIDAEIWSNGDEIKVYFFEEDISNFINDSYWPIAWKLVNKLI